MSPTKETTNRVLCNVFAILVLAGLSFASCKSSQSDLQLADHQVLILLKDGKSTPENLGLFDPNYVLSANRVSKTQNLWKLVLAAKIPRLQEEIGRLNKSKMVESVQILDQKINQPQNITEISKSESKPNKE